MIYRIQLASVLILAGSMTGQTHAQEATSGAAASDLQEVVVSARKRDERLQDVPLTITAVTSEAIKAAGISSVAQLSNMTPGFYFEQGVNRQQSQARMRGMDVNTANPTRQNASFFIDGVYMPGSVQSLDFSEFERVEVIKGPQSALFGRQTFGGAVNFISKVPQNELEAEVAATLGSNRLQEFSGSLSGALVEDRLFARVHLRSYDYAGAFHNALSGERLGSEESLSGSAALIWRATDKLQFDLRYTRQEDDDGPPLMLLVGAADLNCGPFFTGGWRFYCGAIPTGGQPALNTTVAPNSLGIDEFGFDRTAEMLSLKAVYSTAAHNITFIAAKYDENNLGVIDLDYTPVAAYATATYQGFDDRSFELRLASDGTGRLNYVAGVYWYEGNFDQRSFTGTADLSVLPPPTTQPSVGESKNRAAFASVSYALTDRLSGSIEMRYQEDEVTDVGGQGAARRTLSSKTDAWLPRAILDYKLTDDVMVYGIYSEGNKPKQFNANIAGLPAAQQEYIATIYGVGIAMDEERLKNYELGLKSMLFDRRVTLNLATFLMKWDDQLTRRQVFPFEGGPQIDVVDNAGSTEIKGVELESHAMIGSALSLDATLAYINAKYTEFNSVNMQQVFGDAQTAGNEAAKSPKIRGSLAASYTIDLQSDWSATLRIDESFMGKRWTDEVNLAYADSFWRTNLRATLRKGSFAGTVYVENLTDDDGIGTAGRYRDITVPGNNFAFPYTRSEGRKWGVTLRYAL